MPPVQTQSHEIELVLQSTTENIQIAIYTEAGNPIDPQYLKLNILDSYDQLISTDILYPAPGEIVSPVSPRIQRIGRGKFIFPFGADNANGYPAVYYGTLPPAPTWDISVNNQLQIAVDSKTPITITLTAATPTAATTQEIVSSINFALANSPTYGSFYGNVARFECQLFLVSPTVVNVNNSKVQVNLTIPNNAAPVLFGPTAGVAYGTTTVPDPIVVALLSNRTLRTGDALFQWQATMAKGQGSVSIVQVAKIASPKAFSVLPYFRLELDKALKQVNYDQARTGYTDAQLMGYLSLAVTEINAYQPITSLTLDSFPTQQFMMILIWTAVLIALLSQGLFAIDTDIDYSDRGASFRNDHTSKIQSFIQMVTSRLEARMTQFKLQYAPIGVVKIEPSVSFRLATVLNAAPSGSLFRNLFQSGVGPSG